MIRIYIIFNYSTETPIYVGASKSESHTVLFRHMWMSHSGLRRKVRETGSAMGYLQVDEADSIEQAAALEEYWYWQLRSWGFKLDNAFVKSFRRYKPANIYLKAA